MSVVTHEENETNWFTFGRYVLNRPHKLIRSPINLIIAGLTNSRPLCRHPREFVAFARKIIESVTATDIRVLLLEPSCRCLLT
jgi:hypothetical protein